MALCLFDRLSAYIKKCAVVGHKEVLKFVHFTTVVWPLTSINAKVLYLT